MPEVGIDPAAPPTLHGCSTTGMRRSLARLPWPAPRSGQSPAGRARPARCNKLAPRFSSLVRKHTILGIHKYMEPPALIPVQPHRDWVGIAVAGLPGLAAV